MTSGGLLFLSLFVIFRAAKCVHGEDFPPVRIASEVVTLPKGTPWKSAYAEVHFRAQRIGVHSGNGDEVTHIVVLTREDGGHDDVRVAEYSFRYLGRSPKSEREPTLRATFRLSVAPDGHALALRSTKTADWHYVALDTRSPFACQLSPFAGPASGEIWPGSKDTRTLLIESLNTAKQTCPVDLGTLYACAHTEDEALWHALANSAAQNTFAIFHNRPDEERQRVLRCAQEASHRYATVRQAFAKALISGQPDQVGAVAEALAFVDDAATQDALATAYRRFATATTEVSCWSHALPLWALAATASKTGRLSASAVAVVQEAAVAQVNCKNDLATNAARIYAMAALVSLGGADRKRVETLAQDCPVAGFKWPVQYTRGNEVAYSANMRDKLSCWARAALDAEPAKKP